MNNGQTAYWHIVQETMTTFHALSRHAAMARIQRFRTALLSTGDSLALDFATHEEPFYLAARLAGRQVSEPTPAQEKVYGQIQKRCTEEALAFGAMDELFRETQQQTVKVESKAKVVLRRKQPAGQQIMKFEPKAKVLLQPRQPTRQRHPKLAVTA